jgi:peptidoglycan/LPS O-acetylase OafA/YrhL
VPASAHPRTIGLDGLRGVAVAAVVLFHTGRVLEVSWLVRGGYLGVDVFLVLSGFLITTVMVEERRSAGAVDLRRYARRRVGRIVPPLAVLVVVTVVLWVPLSRLHPRIGTDLVATVTGTMNWWKAYQLLPSRTLLAHTWTLALEVQWYVVWPVALVLLLRRARPGLAVAVVAGGVLASTALRVALLLHGSSEFRLYYGLDTRADAFLAGAAAGLALGLGVVPPGPVARWTRRLAPPGGAAVLALALTLPTADPSLYAGGYTLVALSVVAVVVDVRLRPGGALARLLAARPLTAAGRASYSAYLWHWPVLLTVAHLDVPAGVGLVLVLAPTAVLAAASERLVERRRLGVDQPPVAAS